MQEGNWVDYSILSFIGISVILGIWRGFVREAMSLITWVSAITIAIVYFEPVSNWITMISMVGLKMIIAFVLLVLSTLIVGGILSHLITRLIKFTGFGTTDRIVGTFFGLARGAVIVAVAILVAGPTPLSKDPLWVESKLIPRFEPVSLWMKNRIPEDLMKNIEKNLNMT